MTYGSNFTQPLMVQVNPNTGTMSALPGANQVAMAAAASIAALRRQAVNEFTQQSQSPAPLWIAATAYNATDVVRTSTGQLLICTTAGTSAANQPTFTVGSAPAEITDNTAKWWFLGMISVAGLTPAWTAATTVKVGVIVALTTGQRIRCTAPGTTGATQPGYAAAGTITDNTVTWAAVDETVNTIATATDVAGVSALANIVNFYDSPSQFDQLSAPNLFTPGGAGNTKYTTAWSITDGSVNDNGFGANGQNGQFRTIDFETNADLLEIGYIAIVAGFTNERVRILVDGYPLTEAPLIPGAQGTSRFWRVSFSGGRRVRRITIQSYGIGPYLRYVATAADCFIQKPAQKGLLIAGFTDSYGFTESPGISSTHYDFTPSVGQRLGFRHVMTAAVGGTSYAMPSLTGGRQGLQWVLDNNNWAPYSWDAVFIGTGLNAGQTTATVTQAQEVAAALYCWKKIRTLAPSAPMAVIGPWYTLTGGNIALMTALGAALKAQFLALADPNSVYIDPLDGSITKGDGTVIRAATVAWVNTSNAAWVIGTDNTHPSPAGDWYLQDMAVRSMSIGFAALGA